MEVYNIVTNANIIYIFIGYLLHPIFIIIGAIRWYYLINRVERINFLYVLKHYWIGLGLGYFVPSSIGWDLYRVSSIGFKSKQYLQHIIIIIYEKLSAFLSYGSVALILIPLINIKELNSGNYYNTLFVFSSSILIILFLFYFSLKNNFIRNKIKKLVISNYEKFKDKILKKESASEKATNSIDIQKITLLDLSIIYGFTFIIQLITAFSNNLFFLSLGIEIDFFKNLFVISMLTIIFILPISFGSIGVREASYIFLFGLFGISPEHSVTVSIIAFLGLVLNNSIGLIILFFDNLLKKKKRNQMSSNTELEILNEKL